MLASGGQMKALSWGLLLELRGSRRFTGEYPGKTESGMQVESRGVSWGAPGTCRGRGGEDAFRLREAGGKQTGDPARWFRHSRRSSSYARIASAFARIATVMMKVGCPHTRFKAESRTKESQ